MTQQQFIKITKGYGKPRVSKAVKDWSVNENEKGVIKLIAIIALTSAPPIVGPK